MALSSEHPIPHLNSIASVPSAEGEVRAARHVFGRWPLVPSRELRRIRQILLHAESAAGNRLTDDLPESARDLLEHVTVELQHRGQLGSPIQPAHSHSVQAHTWPWKKGAQVHGRSL